MPLAAIAVGTRYAVFRTMYGDRSFWLLAAVITLVGLGDIMGWLPRGWTTLLVAVVELGFGLVLTARGMPATN